MLDPEHAAGIGHNGGPDLKDKRPPLYDETEYRALQARAQKCCDAGGEWAQVEEIESKEQSDRAATYIRRATAFKNEVEKARKVAKQPHIDAGKEVDTAFGLLVAGVMTSIDAAKKVQNAWLKAEQVKAIAAQREAAAEAQREAEEASAAVAAAAERNDALGQAEAAKDAKKRAAKASKGAENVAAVDESGRKLVLRKTVSAKLTNPSRALIRYMEHPDLIALLERLASAELRSKDGPKRVPGFETIVTESC